MPCSSDTVGVLTWDFGPGRGGLGVAMAAMAGALGDAGMRVRVLSPHAPDDIRPLLPSTRFPGGQLAFSALLPLWLGSALTRHGVRTLLFPCGPGGVLLPWRTGAERRIAIVYHTYAQQAGVPGERWKRLLVPLERCTYRHADLLLTFSVDTRDVLAARYGVDAARIRLLRQIHDIDGWAAVRDAPKRSFSCVCVGRLDARKGIETLVRAWPRVREVHPEASLTIVGDGPLGSRVDRLASDVSAGVRWERRLPDAELRSVVAGAEVALCPALLEGFGLSCLEAMAAGTAVVASDVDGLRRLVAHEHTGLLVPPGDADALAAAAVRLLGDAPLRARLAAAARAEARVRFDPAAARRAFIDAVRAG